MTVKESLINAAKQVRRNSPAIFTGGALVGLGATSYLVGKASFQAARIIDHEESITGAAEDRKVRFKERTKLVWRVYIPAGAMGVATAACILGSAKASANRTAAAVTAYSVLDHTYQEYKERVIEEIGESKEQTIRDRMAQAKVEGVPPGPIFVTGTGDVLCCELFTKRYFKSDMETLRKAENKINSRINNELYVTLDEFYDLIGLPYTSVSNKIGWDSDRLMALEFSTVLSEDGRPCLAFDYNYTKPL